MKMQDININQEYKVNISSEKDKEIFLRWFDKDNIEDKFVFYIIGDSIFLKPEDSHHTESWNSIIVDNPDDDIVELLSLINPV